MGLYSGQDIKGPGSSAQPKFLPRAYSQARIELGNAGAPEAEFNSNLPVDSHEFCAAILQTASSPWQQHPIGQSEKKKCWKSIFFKL